VVTTGSNGQLFSTYRLCCLKRRTEQSHWVAIRNGRVHRRRLRWQRRREGEIVRWEELPCLAC
jgi:hypothetical protein